MDWIKLGIWIMGFAFGFVSGVAFASLRLLKRYYESHDFTKRR